MKEIEPDSHLAAPAPCPRETPSGVEEVASQLPRNSSTTAAAQQTTPDCGIGRSLTVCEVTSQPVPPKAIERTQTDSHGLVRPNESVLSSILDQDGELEPSLFPTVLHLLRRLQDEFNLKHRFHLFVESVEKVSDEAAGRGSRSMCPIFTRVAFSPTLSASDKDQKTRLAYVCQKITEFSFGKMPHNGSPASPAFTRSPIEDTVKIPRKVCPSVTVSEQQGIDTNIATFYAAWPLRVYENLTFPSWCPCQAKEYTTTPQASEERLFISKSVLERFIELEYFQIMWIYQELFKFLYRHGRKRKILWMARTLTYSQFTLPWIRRQIAIQPDDPDDANGDQVAEVVTLKKVAITHLRNERNTQGYRRVRFLTEFFCHEPETIKPRIQHLFRTVLSIRAVTKRKVSKKRSHSNESVQPHGNARSKKRLESGSELTRVALSTNQQQGSSSTLGNERRSERRQSSTETYEVQQNAQPNNAVLPQIRIDITANVPTTLRSNVRNPSRTTSRASSPNNRASTPTPRRPLSFSANVTPTTEKRNAEKPKEKSVFDGLSCNLARINENNQPD